MKNGDIRRILSLKEAYKLSLVIAGDKAPALKRSMAFYILSFLAQGLAFSCFYPFLAHLFSEPPAVRKALFWLGAMGMLGIVDVTASWHAHGFDFSGTIVDVTHDLRVKLGKKLKSMPLEILHARRTGDLNATLAGNVDDSVLYVGVVASLLIQTTLVPAVIIAVTFFVDWRMAAAMLIIFPLGVPVYKWRRRISRDESGKVASAHSTVESDIVEYTQGLPVLKSLNQTGSRSVRLQASIEVLRNEQTKGLLLSTLPTLIMATLVEIGMLVVLSLGVFLMLGGGFTVPALGALLVAVSRFSEPVAVFVNITPVLDVSQAAFARIQALLSVRDMAVKTPEETPEAFAITFDEVGFSYAGESVKAIENLSFSLPPQSLTAIVGASGAGKSTVARLIMRYADPQAGTVRIGGKDLRFVPQETVMGCVSAVFQDVYLFDDTILNNIRMGRPDASDRQVEDAAKAAFCHEFIRRLPKGYQTRVGDIGKTLSGGERQRISIARAILKDAPIVILDEPTAQLDTESEIVVQSAMDALVRDRTVLVIAHRLSIIKDADKILVLEAGRLAEAGSHDELVKKSGRYLAMWRAQQRIKQWRFEGAGN